MAKNIPIKDKIIECALEMAASESWADLDFEEIVEKSGVSAAEAMEYFDDKTDILVAYGRRLDKQLAEIAADMEQSDDIRERLFDIIMERFDLINENRDAVLSILESVKFDPKQALLTFPHLGKSMGRILELAGDDIEGVKGCLKITGLTGIYLYTVKTWKEDDSADMGKTMATLDKSLSMAEEITNSFGGGDFGEVFSSVKNIFRKDDA